MSRSTACLWRHNLAARLFVTGAAAAGVLRETNEDDIKAPHFHFKSFNIAWNLAADD